MSSDFNINLAQLHDKGLIEVIEPYTDEYKCVEDGKMVEEAYEGTQVKFTHYEWFRDCSVEGGTLNLSCSGRFRQWLTQYLKDNQIEYVEY